MAWICIQKLKTLATIELEFPMTLLQIEAADELEEPPPLAAT
jgi:hypothetical protein